MDHCAGEIQTPRETNQNLLPRPHVPWLLWNKCQVNIQITIFWEKGVPQNEYARGLTSDSIIALAMSLSTEVCKLIYMLDPKELWKIQSKDDKVYSVLYHMSCTAVMAADHIMSLTVRLTEVHLQLCDTMQLVNIRKSKLAHTLLKVNIPKSWRQQLMEYRRQRKSF